MLTYWYVRQGGEVSQTGDSPLVIVTATASVTEEQHAAAKHMDMAEKLLNTVTASGHSDPVIVVSTGSKVIRICEKSYSEVSDDSSSWETEIFS